MVIVKEQLSRQPFAQTANRKPLLRECPFGEDVWELRFGPQNRFRVFYRADPDSPRRILVEAIGRKERNRLMVGGKEVKVES